MFQYSLFYIKFDLNKHCLIYIYFLFLDEFELFSRSGLIDFRLQYCCLVIFCIICAPCHSTYRFTLVDAATCAAMFPCGLAFKCLRFARPAGGCPFAPAPRAQPRARPRAPVLYNEYLPLIIQYIIALCYPPLSFLPRRVHVAIFFFAAAERPQGVRRFLSSAGSGAPPPRFFCKFLFFSSFFFSFFLFFFFFFFCCAYILPPAGGN